MKRWQKIVVGVGVSVMGLGLCLGSPCLTAWARWGIAPERCPDGTPRALVDVSTYGLERGREGSIRVDAQAGYLHPWGHEDAASMRRFSAQAELVVGEETIPLDCDWETPWTGARECEIALPKTGIPDGDHTLRVAVDTPLDEDPVVEVPLPLYVPAAAHVITDRPLYEPGQTVSFRSLTLRRSDLAPIDDRPGVWIVRDPNGQILLEERSAGGTWGIADSSFPLAPDAFVGTWTVAWRSGDDVGEAEFDVRPFTLPRFSVEASSDDPWYAPGEVPSVSGVVRYSSGAPVAGAAIQARWYTNSAWPPPLEWLEEFALQAGPDGRFETALPAVPDDLQGTSRLTLRLLATDPAGEQIRSAASVLLSQDPIAVDAVTELGEGLVGGFSNRAYLRVTTPDGRPLDGATVSVKRAWDPRDPGKEGVADADGVVALQIDPGEPVQVVIPPQPVRARPDAAKPPFTAGSAKSLLRERAVGIADRRRLDEMADDLVAACGPLTQTMESRDYVLSIVGGRVARVLPAESGLDRCVARTVQGQPLGAGRDLYEVSWNTALLSIPRLRVSIRDPLGEGPRDVLSDAAAEAWACVADWEDGRAVPWDVIWQTRAGSAAIGAELVPVTEVRGAASAKPCLQRAFQGLTLAEPADADGAGVAQLYVDVPSKPRERRPTPTVQSGYEFTVSAAEVGETTWRAWPGQVPNVRLRPSKILLDPGESFDVEILRGPDFSGDLPRELDLYRGADLVQEVEHEEPQRSFTFTPPDDAQGFLSVSWSGAKTLVYVRPAATLEVDIASDRDVYAPGDVAELTITTSAPAVVSLSGVDTALGQLAPLPGAGELADSLVPAESSQPAFELFDAVALATGKIRGEQAARAAVLRVDQVREVSALSPYASHNASWTYDAVAETATAFYDVLPRVRQGLRAWEEGAADDALLTNEVMAGLWADALDAAEADGAPALDTWQRPLELANLPEPLLARVDPRVLVSDATRLPEDVVDWTRWVYTEAP